MKKPTMRAEEYVGKRCGRLLILKLLHRVNKNVKKDMKYECICDCGNVVIRLQSSLRAGILGLRNPTLSCGCLRDENCRRTGTAFRRCIEIYKRNAKKRNISWNLTDEQFRVLTSSPCYYTGRLPYREILVESGERYFYNGIDRKNSNEGYYLDNCIPCCFEVNRAKSSLSHDEFLSLCKQAVLKCASL
jgi:hypothetical protein